MPAYNHDDRLVAPDEVRPPNFASVLLVDLRVEHEPEEVQRRAVAGWLAEHEPSAALLGSLRRAGFVDRPTIAPSRGLRRRTVDGDLVQIRLRDRNRLVALRQDRPDEKGRPGRSLSQRQVAAAVGISHGYYGDLEAGRRHPSFAVGERLAAYFGLALDELFEVAPAASSLETVDGGARRDRRPPGG